MDDCSQTASAARARRLPRFYLVGEAADVGRVSPWTIRKEIAEGRLRARRVGRCVRILDDDLDAWMRGELPESGDAA